MDGLPFQQDDSQVQILTVGHSSGADDGEVEPAISCTHSQSKQDLRVTMLKKGTVASRWYWSATRRGGAVMAFYSETVICKVETSAKPEGFAFFFCSFTCKNSPQFQITA